VKKAIHNTHEMNMREKELTSHNRSKIQYYTSIQKNTHIYTYSLETDTEKSAVKSACLLCVCSFHMKDLHLLVLCAWASLTDNSSNSLPPTSTTTTTALIIIKHTNFNCIIYTTLLYNNYCSGSAAGANFVPKHFPVN
jgi:hypothetical protein